MSDEEGYSPAERQRNHYAVKEQRAEGCGVITGAIVFAGAWIYCMSEYGFLFGFGLGWLPAGILASMVGGVVYLTNRPQGL